MHSIAAEYNWPDFHPTVRTAIQVDPKILAQYVGTYPLQPNFNVIITLDNGQLISQATGKARFPCTPSRRRCSSPRTSMPRLSFRR